MNPYYAIDKYHEDMMLAEEAEDRWIGNRIKEIEDKIGERDEEYLYQLGAEYTGFRDYKSVGYVREVVKEDFGEIYKVRHDLIKKIAEREWRARMNDYDPEEDWREDEYGNRTS